MLESDWVKKRLMNTKESTLEWIGTFLFIFGFLVIIILYNTYNELDPSVIRTVIFIAMIIVGGFYSLLFFGALGSFFPQPEEKKSIFDDIELIPYFIRHPKQKRAVKVILAFTVINALIYASVYAIIGFYNWLLMPVQISNIAIAILVAILIEHSFQLLGIGFKNIIQYQVILESQENLSEE